jgi:peptide/nickel transport system permease protein
MAQFVTRRFVLLLPVLVGILVVTFTLVRLIPGDPCKAMLGERATEAKCDAFRDRFGLNDSIPVQFGRYVGNLMRGDFGTSIQTGRPVTDVLAERLPMTIELTFFAVLWPRASSWGSFLRCGRTAPRTSRRWWSPTPASRCRSSGSA